MKTLKVFFLLSLPILLEVMIACCKCSPTQESNFVNCDFEAHHLIFTGDYPEITTADSTLKTVYGIQIAVNRKENICSAQSSFYFNAAYACSCVPLYSFNATNAITKINIITINEFDEQHLAGSDISDYFIAEEYSKSYSIPNYINTRDSILYSDVSFTDSNFDEWTTDLFLKTPPAGNSEHQFKVIVTFSDGQILEEQLSPIKLY